MCRDEMHYYGKYAHLSSYFYRASGCRAHCSLCLWSNTFMHTGNHTQAQTAEAENTNTCSVDILHSTQAATCSVNVSQSLA